MKAAHDSLELPLAKFEKPGGIQDREICNVTKKLPLPACPIEQEIFKEGTEPTQNCKVHKTG